MPKGIYKHRPHSEETKIKISKNHKGMISKNHSEETKKKISITKKGNSNPNSGSFKKGHKMTIEIRKKISESMSGSKTHLWKGGITPINMKIRSSLEYKLWREAVFKRDNYTCIWCKKQGGKLNADHIKPFAYYPELRFAIDNGRTLCIDCHKKTDTYLVNKTKNR